MAKRPLASALLLVLLAGCASSSTPPASPADPVLEVPPAPPQPARTLHDCRVVTWSGETLIPMAQAALPDGYSAAGEGTTTVLVEAFDCAGIHRNGTLVGNGKFATLGIMVGNARGNEDPDAWDFLLLRRYLDRDSPEVAVATRQGPWLAVEAEIFVGSASFSIDVGVDDWLAAAMEGEVHLPLPGITRRDRVHIDVDDWSWQDVERQGHRTVTAGDLIFGYESPPRTLFPSGEFNSLPGEGRIAFLDTFQMRPLGDLNSTMQA